MGRRDYCAYCGDCRCETPRDCVAAAVRERDEARAKLPVLTAFITGCRYCGAWAAETGCADCLLTQRDTARAELEEWKRDAIGKLTAVLDAACSERDEAIAEAERLRAVFEVIIAGKIVADPWSITSMLAKERDKIRVERDEAQKAAETYHEAWQDAAVYWKDKVQHLRAEWHEFQRKHPRFSR